MIDRFRPIWLIKALVFEAILRFKNLLRIGKQRHDKEVQRIINDFNHLKNHENGYLRELLRKYPDQAWAQKYVKAGRGMSVPGILAFHVLGTRKLHSIWTDEATIADCRYIIDLQMPLTTVIRQPDGTPHAIGLTGYSVAKREFYFYDSLGSYNAKYRLHHNTKNWISEKSLEEKNVGHPIHSTIVCTDIGTFDRLRKYFRGRKYYWSRSFRLTSRCSCRLRICQTITERFILACDLGESCSSSPRGSDEVAA